MLIGLLKGTDDIFFFIEQLYHIVAGIDFFHLAIDISQISLLLLEILLRMLHHICNDEHGKRKDEAKPPASSRY